jgi:hypothetical protein
MLRVLLNGQVLVEGDDWNPVGGSGTLSSLVSLNEVLSVGDVLVFRIDARGGVFIASDSSPTTSLQAAYNTNRFITAQSGQPVTVIGAPQQTVIQTTGDVSVSGTVYSNGLVISNGYVSKPIVSTSTNLALDLDSTVLMTATSGNQTVTLPSAVSQGRVYTVKRVTNGASSYTVATVLSQKIDGGLTYALTSQYSFVTLQSDGSNWHVIGKG